MTYNVIILYDVHEFVRKTLYVDVEANTILDALPSRSQSKFVSQAIKFYNIEKKNNQSEIPHIKVRISNAEN